MLAKLSAALVSLALALAAAPAAAQNATCPTAAPGDNSNRCASTAFVQAALASAGFTIGTSVITGGTSNGLLYDNAGVLGNLATGNNGVLVTSAGGVPSISSTLSSGLTIPAPIVTTSLTYGGVTLANSVTGTGAMVLATNPQFANNIGVGTAALNAFNLNIAGTFDGSTNDSAALQVASIGNFTAGGAGTYTNTFGQFIAPAWDAKGLAVTLTLGGGLRFLNPTLLATGGGAVTFQNNEAIHIDNQTAGTVTNYAIHTVGATPSLYEGIGNFTHAGQTAQFGANTASQSYFINLQSGGSGSGTGAYLEFEQGASATAFLGGHSGLFGGTYNQNVVLESISNDVEICPNSGGSFSAGACLSANNMVGAWTAFSASPSCGTATFTVNSARSKTIGKTTYAQIDITITAIGTCTNQGVTVSLPNTANSAGAITGADTANSGKGLNCFISASGTTAACEKADVSAFAVNDRLIASGVYENQ